MLQFVLAPASDPAADFLAGDLASVPEPVEEIAAPGDSPVDLSAEFAQLDEQNVEVMNEGLCFTTLMYLNIYLNA